MSGFLPGQIRDQLRSDILKGKIPEGMPLLQSKLASRFKTSRIPVREALRQLAAEGLVSYHENRGATVSRLSLEEVLDLIEVRIALECHAIKLAVPNMVQADISTAEQLLLTYDAEQDAENWGDFNWKFHQTLYAPCDSPRLLALIQDNYGHVDRFLRLQVSLATGKNDPQRDHWEILKACRHQDADRASRLMEEHLSDTKKALVAATRRARAELDTGNLVRLRLVKNR
jgi:DNA-binding GntR family transcriptional regulator